MILGLSFTPIQTSPRPCYVYSLYNWYPSDKFLLLCHFTFCLDRQSSPDGSAHGEGYQSPLQVCVRRPERLPTRKALRMGGRPWRFRCEHLRKDNYLLGSCRVEKLCLPPNCTLEFVQFKALGPSSLLHNNNAFPCQNAQETLCCVSSFLIRHFVHRVTVVSCRSHNSIISKYKTNTRVHVT